MVSTKILFFRFKKGSNSNKIGIGQKIIRKSSKNLKMIEIDQIDLKRFVVILPKDTRYVYKNTDPY